VPLSDVANIQISTSGAGLTQPGFGTALILGGYSKAWAERTRFYSELAGGVDVDFAVGTPEYLAAEKLLSQNPRPELIAIGRGTRKPTQVFKLTIPAVLAQVVTKFSLTIAGAEVSFTSDANPTQAEVAQGLTDAINVGTAAHHLGAVKDAGNGFITITHDTVGGWTRLAMVDQAPGVQVLSIEETSADPGVAADLGEIAVESGANWYALVTTHKSTAIVTAAAAWVEANEKLYPVQSIETAIPNTALAGATDIATAQKALAHARTGVFYDPDNGAFLDAALLGRVLPLTAGSETWALKTLSGIVARTYTGTQLVNLKAKLCGWYYSLWGRNVTQEGKVAAGEYFDTIRGRDALKVDMQGRVFLALAIPDKVPFTDGGASMVAAEIHASLEAYVRIGFLVEGSTTVTMPKISTVSVNDKALRKLTGIKFGAQLAGAIHKTDIAGVLTN
jgi:hypothetical protein